MQSKQPTKKDSQAVRNSIAYQALEKIGEFYDADTQLKELTSKERLQKRQEIIRPLVEEFFAWVKKQVAECAVPPKTKTGQGLQYIINQEPYLKVFLTDGDVPIDNSASERAIRTFCIGKKNWMFHNSANGASASACIYSISETAKLNNLRPYYYFKYILTELPKKTVMDEPRIKDSEGKVNNCFEQFAKDYGFKVRPCIAGRPQTKAKVEAPMKILDEIRAYSGRLDYTELCELVERINNRINSQVNQGTGRIPLLYFEKEKAFLNPLPTEEIRKHYRIATHRCKVNSSSMITYKNSQYSVPPEYIGKEMKLQVYDNYIHIYHNTTLVTLHSVSLKKLNYHEKHYIAIAQQSHSFPKEDIESRAKENLSVIGDVYHYE